MTLDHSDWQSWVILTHRTNFISFVKIIWHYLLQGKEKYIREEMDIVRWLGNVCVVSGMSCLYITYVNIVSCEHCIT